MTERNANIYEVELPVSIYPAKDTFEIGDTLWVEHSFPQILVDKRNGLELNFMDFDLVNKLVFSDLINYNDVAIHQDVNIIVGSSVQSSTGGLFINYEKTNDSLKYKVSIVMKKAGLFDLAFLNIGDNKVDFTRCMVEYLLLSFATNNNASNNYFMVNNSLDPSFSNISKSEYDKLGTYCFYVR